jgi:hypothetical protein
LRRLQRLLVDHETAICEAIDADFGGRPFVETELAEIWPSLEEVKGALRHGRALDEAAPRGVGKWFIPAAPRCCRSRWAWRASSCPGTTRCTWLSARWWRRWQRATA